MLSPRNLYDAKLTFDTYFTTKHFFLQLLHEYALERLLLQLVHVYQHVYQHVFLRLVCITLVQGV